MAIVFYSFIGQGISISASKTSQRMLIFSIYITGGVLLWSYSAVLISFLTVEKLDYPIKSYRVSCHKILVLEMFHLSIAIRNNTNI
jgi:hypothetical protein